MVLVAMKLTKFLITEPLGNKYILIVNCLSGAVDFFRPDIYKALKEEKFEDIPLVTLISLKTRGYIFENREEEHALLSSLKNKYEHESITDFVICPTFDCNLACTYCFQKTLTDKQVYLTKDSIPDLIKAINKMETLFKGKKVIQLFGGEPLLPKNKPFISEILAFSKHKNLPVAVTTNGTTILYYKKLIKQYSQTIKIIQITVDGPPSIHNTRRASSNGKPTFHLILAGIDFLLGQQIGVQMRVNVDKSNVGSLPRLASLLQKKGVFKNKNFKCSLAPVDNHCKSSKVKGLMNENDLLKTISSLANNYSVMKFFAFDRIPKTLKHLHSLMFDDYSGPKFKYCAANRHGYFVFGPDGLIYPCTEAAGHKELAVGEFIPTFKIYSDKLDLWYKRSILDIPKCQHCQIAPLCGGGCTYAAYGINGNVSDPYCHQAKQIISQYLKENKNSLLSKAQQAKTA